ncbi:SLBB domain-containing protein [Robbsia sp. KACC 23696]|uniref:polysaccharide biosynthesis/export family protein n=1 Tax=Robbsia sp. KACC 23696 TaxID=3149231 RepID=UPI00325AA5AD
MLPLDATAQSASSQRLALSPDAAIPRSSDTPPIPEWIQSDEVSTGAPAVRSLASPTLRTSAAGANSLGRSSATFNDRAFREDSDPFRERDLLAGADPHWARTASTTREERSIDPLGRHLPVRLNAFQQFVLDTTGRRLPVFGQSLFDSDVRAQYTAVQNKAVPDDYVIGVDDSITLHVWGAVEGDLQLTVDRNGQIAIPKIGNVTVAGSRASNLDAVLKQAIGRNFTGFEASASLNKLRSIQVYVVGQAKRPGAYTVSSMSTLVNALFASGGPGPNGSMRQIALRRGGVLVGTVDLYGFITRGKSDGDRHLMAGDVIVIPPAGARVALLGALDSPAIYELKGANESLADVLGYAGGTTALTSTDKVTIERVDAGGGLLTPGRSVEALRLDVSGLGRVVKDGDVVTLQKINPSFKNAITLRGNVAASLRYPYRDGMRLSDLLPEPEALLTPDYFKRKNVLVQIDAVEVRKTGTAQFEANRIQSLIDEPNWRYAVIERMDRQRLTTRLLPFNLGAVVHKTDPTQDLLLEPGDIVTVFGSQDMRLPRDDHTRLIRVDGEVRSAGVYELLPNDTVQSILVRAGGVTSSAYVYGTEFTREQTRLQQETNLQDAIRRMDQQASARLASLVASMSNNAGTSDALAAQMTKHHQTQLARLRDMRPTGRVSLELDAAAQRIEDLPDLALDNGDTLYIPPMPAFVTVMGAVNNENAIIWREGRTVADVLRVAGVQSDIADTRRTFVLRADGSVYSRDSANWRRSLEATKLMPGDTVVVPEKADPRSTMTKFMAGLKDWSQVISQLGLGVAAIKVLNR